MEDLIARPRVLKQVNLSAIRKAIKSAGTATRAEIAWKTQISATTVRLLLTEMQQNGEIESVGYDASSGGRQAGRYALTKNRYYGAAFCLEEGEAHYVITDICGGIVQTGRLRTPGGEITQPVTAFLDTLCRQKEIRAIGFGVPGVVEGNNYMQGVRDIELQKIELGGLFSSRYGVPVVLENNLNAIAIGFGLCYERQFPTERAEDTNIAYLHFLHSCVSAGFIAGGKILRGCNNFAGELGLIPLKRNKTLDALMAEPMNEAEYVALITQIIVWICGILNPRHVVLGGPGYRKECHGLIGDGFYALLPDKMLPEILYAPNYMHDYYEGMAFLTAARIFDEVQLTKE